MATLGIQLSKNMPPTSFDGRKTLHAPSALPAGPRTGGDDRDRTDGLRLAKPALSQLSYIPIGTAHMARSNFWWWARVESNYRPHAYQACALTN